MKKSILTLIATVMISMIGFAQYCTPSYMNPNGTLYIKNLTFGTINNTDTAGYANGINTFGIKHYLVYPTTKYTATVYTDSTYQLNMTMSLAFFVSVWIDYNGDGDFADAGENVFVTGTTGVSTVNKNIVIPSTPTLGVTRMRVIYAGGNLYGNEYCNTFAKGETQDYTITIAKSITTGISEQTKSFDGKILIYPNPSSGNINLEMNVDKTTDIQINVMDALGQIIKSNVITEVSGNIKSLIDLQDKAPGIYFVKVNDLNSNKSLTQRLLIQ